MAYCIECGAQLPESSKYCAQCGAAVPARQETTVASGGAHGADGAVRVATLAVGALANTSVIEAPDAAGEFVAGMWNGDVLPAAAAVAQAAQIAQGAAQQVQATQPNAHRPSDGTAPKPKKKSKLPLVIVAAIVIVLFAVYVVPRFISHPHDPHEDMASPSSLSQTSPNSSAAAASSGESTSGVSSPAEPRTSTSQGASSSSSSQQPAKSTAASSSSNSQQPAKSTAASSSTEPVSPQSFSTTERPELTEFTWLTGDAAKGNVPAGAARLTKFADVEGGWKGYVYGSDMEWLLNVRIDSVQGGVAVTLDWYYLRIGGASGEVRKDDAPDVLFSGSWSGGMLDATGSGRITIAAFWEKDGHQYATGSFIWPSGETGTIALVRP